MSSLSGYDEHAGLDSDHWSQAEAVLAARYDLKRYRLGTLRPTGNLRFFREEGESRLQQEFWIELKRIAEVEFEDSNSKSTYIWLNVPTQEEP